MSKKAFDKIAEGLHEALAIARGEKKPAKPRRTQMIKLSALHKRMMKDPEYRKEYDALEDEFALIAAVAKARLQSGLSRAELAKRMKTTQSTVARLESGRSLPSTRTLSRFAKATGHRLKISFEPIEKSRKRAGR